MPTPKTIFQSCDTVHIFKKTFYRFANLVCYTDINFLELVAAMRVLIRLLCLLSLFPALAIARPVLPVNSTWHIQLNGKLQTPDRHVYDIDLYDTPTQTISDLKKNGHIVICYFSAGTWEDWRTDAKDFVKSALGKQLADWPQEHWLDIRRDDVRAVLLKRLILAKNKGCNGVDADNVDGYSNDNGLRLKSSDQLDFNRWLALQAHNQGLIIGLKNAVALLPYLSSKFDFAINEGCYQYNECDGYRLMHSQSKPVFIMDYRSYNAKLCTAAKVSGYNLQFYKRSLTGVGTPCT